VSSALFIISDGVSEQLINSTSAQHWQSNSHATVMGQSMRLTRYGRAQFIHLLSDIYFSASTLNNTLNSCTVVTMFLDGTSAQHRPVRAGFSIAS